MSGLQDALAGQALFDNSRASVKAAGDDIRNVLEKREAAKRQQGVLQEIALANKSGGAGAAEQAALAAGQTDIAKQYGAIRASADEQRREDMDKTLAAYTDLMTAFKQDPDLLSSAPQIKARFAERFPLAKEFGFRPDEGLSLDDVDTELASLGQLSQVQAAQEGRSMERRKLSQADRRLDISSQNASKTSNGITVGTDENGNPVVQIGGPAGQFGTKGRNELDNKRIQTADQLQRIKQIEAAFDERFLRVGPRFNNIISTAKDKGILPGDVTDAERTSIAEFSEFKRTAFANLNRTLNELSGAAVTQQEFERLKRQMPNPGEGVFDGDSPTEFETKMDALTRQLKVALMRYNYSQATGNVSSAAEVASLDGMKDFVNSKAKEIEAGLRASHPEADDDAIRQTTVLQLRRLFGEL